MTALAAKAASFTSTPNSHGPPLTSNNGGVHEFLASLQPTTIFHPPLGTSTSPPVEFRIENSMVADSETHHHHDDCWPTDFIALQADITQTFTTFSAFLDTLAPFPTKPLLCSPQWKWHQSQQPTMMFLALLAVGNQWLMPMMLQSSSILDTSLWIYLHYSERFSNSQMTWKPFLTPCWTQLVISNAVTTDTTPTAGQCHYQYPTWWPQTDQPPIPLNMLPLATI